MFLPVDIEDPKTDNANLGLNNNKSIKNILYFESVTHLVKKGIFHEAL